MYVFTLYLSRSCTGMTDDEILRAEMVSQLCMNDRTHSALLDLVSSTTLPTKDILTSNYIKSSMASFFLKNAFLDSRESQPKEWRCTRGL